MTWVIIDDSGEQEIYGRVDDDGLIRVTCVSEYPEFAEWIEKGNSPLPLSQMKTGYN